MADSAFSWGAFSFQTTISQGEKLMSMATMIASPPSGRR